MSRRRSTSSQEDSLDLLLDTVSNVFGGVMFLTLLAALLILTRGTEKVVEEEFEPPEIDAQVEAQLVSIEIRQIASAIDAQQKMLERFDPDGKIESKAERLASLKETLAVARRQVRRADTAVANRQQELEDQQAKQSDLEEQIEELKEKLAEKAKEVNKIRSESERTVEFRPLSASMTMEAVVVLRYGRWYLLYENARGKLNREDFYVLPGARGVITITAKPHRGQRVSEASLSELASKLKGKFPSRQFHVTIAVWDDSFAEFNDVKDALKGAGYRYRTLTCDSSTSLSNQGAVDAYTQ